MEKWEEDLVDQVRTLAREKFAPRAARHDREGSFAPENVAELKALGVPGMAIDPALGGRGASPECWLRIIEAIAYSDGSTAVALNMHLLIAGFIGTFPPFPRRNAVLEDVGKNNALLCGAGSVPSGEVDARTAGFTAREDGDEVVVNGRAGFASMSEGATYTLMGASVDRGEGNEPDIAIALPSMDTPGLRIMHNWDGMGLRATASHDIVAENARLPKSEVMIVPAAMLRMVRQAQASVTNPATQRQAQGALGICAIWLGLAQAAFDFTLEYVRERHGYLAGPAIDPALSVGFRADQAWAQFGIGDMDHWLETGRGLLYESVRQLDGEFATSQAFVRSLSRTVYHLRRMSEEVSQGAMKVCGAHAYVRSKPLERIFRDMVGGNVMAWKTDELQLSLGRAALGIPITFVGPAGT